jgi:hypothetical protein
MPNLDRGHKNLEYFSFQPPSGKILTSADMQNPLITKSETRNNFLRKTERPISILITETEKNAGPFLFGKAASSSQWREVKNILFFKLFFSQLHKNSL